MASRTVRARLDQPAERALSILMGEGRNESEALRTALIEAGSRRSQRSALAEEVARLVDDPADRVERETILEEMEQVAPEWPS